MTTYENSESNEYRFLEHINAKKDEQSEGIDLLYTQVLNGKRIQNNDVVYVFDEVGCGKTISSIMCMASVIHQKQLQGDVAKILVITPKSVCNQFEDEINKVLIIEKNHNEIIEVKNIAFENNNSINDTLKNLSNDKVAAYNHKSSHEKSNKHNIIVTNHHKLKNELFKQINWDLLVVDEAHDIVCNNQKQSEIYFGDHIENSYIDYLNKLNQPSDGYDNRILHNLSLLKERMKEIESLCGEDETDNNVRFVKFLVLHEYNGYIDLMSRMIKKSEGEKAGKDFSEKYSINLKADRNEETKIYRGLCLLNSDKIAFLSATPYKNCKDIDFCNYAFVASKIKGNTKFYFEARFNTEYLPDFSWVDKVFMPSDLDNELIELNEMEKSNTSLFFKEIAQAILFNEEDSQSDTRNKNQKNGTVDYKYREVELWEEKTGDDFSKKIFDIINKGRKFDDLPNRVIIFVSNSMEGRYIFEKIFPDEKVTKDGEKTIKGFDIVENSEHWFSRKVDERNEVTCEFIMNKFGNAHKIKTYSKEDKKIHIPDILIVTYQVAQVGVNLPTFNHVIHFHIPSSAGALEQRYGRIDRLNTKYKRLYNIYYVDNSRFSSIYKINLVRALAQYKNEITRRENNLPVKNLLLCDKLKINEISPRSNYELLASWLFGYIKFIKKHKPDKIIDLKKMLAGTEWEHLTIDQFDKEKIVIMYDGNSINVTPKVIDYWNDEVEAFNGEKSFGEETIDIDDPVKKKEQNLKEMIENIVAAIRDIKQLNERVAELNKMRTDEKGGPGSPGSIIYLSKNKDTLTDIYDGKQVIVSSRDIVEKIIRSRTCNTK